MQSLLVATVIFGCRTNGSDCLSDPMTIGSHPEVGCQSQPISQTEKHSGSSWVLPLSEGTAGVLHDSWAASGSGMTVVSRLLFRLTWFNRDKRQISTAKNGGTFIMAISTPGRSLSVPATRSTPNQAACDRAHACEASIRHCTPIRWRATLCFHWAGHFLSEAMPPKRILAMTRPGSPNECLPSIPTAAGQKVSDTESVK